MQLLGCICLHGSYPNHILALACTDCQLNRAMSPHAGIHEGVWGVCSNGWPATWMRSPLGGDAKSLATIGWMWRRPSVLPPTSRCLSHTNYQPPVLTEPLCFCLLPFNFNWSLYFDATGNITVCLTLACRPSAFAILHRIELRPASQVTCMCHSQCFATSVRTLGLCKAHGPGRLSPYTRHSGCAWLTRAPWKFSRVQ